KEVIDRALVPTLLDGLTEVKPALAEGQRETGSDDINMVWLDRDAILDLNDRHGGVTAQNLGHEALMLRRQVLHDDEGHAAVGRSPVEKGFQRLDTPGRSADAYDRERQISAADEILRSHRSRRSIRRLFFELLHTWVLVAVPSRERLTTGMLRACDP